jgi:hypothetical protein
MAKTAGNCVPNSAHIAFMFTRRLGVIGGQSVCSSGHSCPEVLELESGDFAVIGADITAEACGHLPAGCGCGSEERVVRIPRALLIRARRDIPKSL